TCPTRLLVSCLCLATSSVLIDRMPAQVPTGHAVVGTRAGSGTPTAVGLFFVDLGTGGVTSVTGLPAALTSTVQSHGVYSVALRCSDDAVIAANSGAGAINVYVMHLNGSAVVSTDTIYVGTPVSGSGGARVVVMPNDNIYVRGLSQFGLSGPMASSGHGIIDVSTSPATLVALPSITGYPTASGLLGGMALDATGSRIYQLWSTPPNAVVRYVDLASFDLQTLTWCTVASWPNQSAVGLAVDDDGTVHVSASQYGTQNHFVHSLHVNGCTNTNGITTVQSSIPRNTWAFDMDRSRGDFVLGTTNGGIVAGNTVSRVDQFTGQVTILTGGPGWGRIGPGGVAVNNAMKSYGTASDGLNRYSFDNFPNPDGQPVIGNSNFKFTMSSQPGTAQASLLGLSLGRGCTQIFGIKFLLAPASTLLFSVPSAVGSTYSLQIPPIPALIGFKFTAQSLHIESTGLFAASRGLSITIS
ncbi:MAG: hypothetical protein ACJA0V_003772, partial [Planctomycetota bacterium]